jgi:ATP-binding cassette, subfamily C, bacterial LapB
MIDNELYQDPLLKCLVLFTERYHKPMTVESLVAGLPVEKGQETPELFSTTNSKSLFSRAAKKAGLSSRLVKEDIEHLSNLVLPAILVLKDQKACILESINQKTGEAQVIVPGVEDMETIVAFDKLQQEYLGYMFLLKKAYKYKAPEHNALAQKQKHWFWGTLFLSKNIYRDVIIASFVINLFLVASPLFIMNVYDRVVPNSAIETLWVLAIGILVIYIFDLLLKNIRSYFLELAAKKSDVIISSILFEKVLDIKISERPGQTGSFASNLRDFDAIRGFITSSTLTALIDIPFTVIFLFVIWLLSGLLVLIPIAIAAIILIYIFTIKLPLQRSIEETYEAAANRNAVLIESLYNLETIKTMGASGQVQWQWEEATGEISNKGLKSKILSGSIPSIIQFFTQVMTLAIVIFGVYLIDAKELTMGALIATVMLSSRALAPVGQVASLVTNYENTKTAYYGLENIMKMDVEHPELKDFVQRDEFKGEIEFKNVTFKYGKEDKAALDKVSFKIKAGEKVAIIGKIGSGKSTIEKMMLGLYEAQDGSITYDGIDIQQLDPLNLRKHIGYVSQDITLFSGTLKENVVYKHPQATNEQIIKVAKLSGIEDFINRHPKGFDMQVGERGDGLSGGQRQAISVARALVVPSPILLLDEPTNMMDNTTENRLIRNLKEYIEDKTTVVVTHKMSLLTLVDRVIVMDEGRVILDGEKNAVIKQLNGGKDGKK